MEYEMNGKKHIAPNKEDFLVAAKDFYKQRGFLKDKNRWAKTESGLKKVFFIEGSQWDKNDYYVRTGLFISEIEKNCYFIYGHVYLNVQCFDRSIDSILNESFEFLDKYDSLDALSKLMDIDYEKRADLFFDFHAENYLNKKRYQNFIQDSKIDEFLKDSIISYIRNDRLKIFALDRSKNYKTNSIEAQSVQEFKNGTGVDLFKLKFKQNNREGMILIRNGKVESFNTNTKGFFINKTDKSWFDFCNIINDQKYSFKPINIFFENTKKTLKIVGTAEKGKDIRNIELAMSYDSGEIYGFWND